MPAVHSAADHDAGRVFRDGVGDEQWWGRPRRGISVSEECTDVLPPLICEQQRADQPPEQRVYWCAVFCGSCFGSDWDAGPARGLLLPISRAGAAFACVCVQGRVPVSVTSLGRVCGVTARFRGFQSILRRCVSGFALSCGSKLGDWRRVGDFRFSNRKALCGVRRCPGHFPSNTSAYLLKCNN